jgi:hypothetical protein
MMPITTSSSTNENPLLGLQTDERLEKIAQAIVPFLIESEFTAEDRRNCRGK